MKIIDTTLLDKVSAEAKVSPMLRMNYNFHQSLDDKCHRFLNAVEPNSVIFECKEGPFSRLASSNERLKVERVEHEVDGILNVEKK